MLLQEGKESRWQTMCKLLAEYNGSMELFCYAFIASSHIHGMTEHGKLTFLLAAYIATKDSPCVKPNAKDEGCATKGHLARRLKQSSCASESLLDGIRLSWCNSPEGKDRIPNKLVYYSLMTMNHGDSHIQI